MGDGLEMAGEFDEVEVGIGGWILFFLSWLATTEVVICCWAQHRAHGRITGNRSFCEGQCYQLEAKWGHKLSLWKVAIFETQMGTFFEISYETIFWVKLVPLVMAVCQGHQIYFCHWPLRPLGLQDACIVRVSCSWETYPQTTQGPYQRANICFCYLLTILHCSKYKQPFQDCQNSNTSLFWKI